MLCLKQSDFKYDGHVQKIDLAEVLKHTKQFTSSEEAYTEGYVPLDFSVSVRSMYDNTVVVNTKHGNPLCYSTCVNIGDFPHKGYDLVMYVSSLGFLDLVDYAPGFDDLMMKHSQFIPIGLLNLHTTDGFPVNPIVYSHIIMSDEGMRSLNTFLKPGNVIVPINTIDPKVNLSALVETLVEVNPKSMSSQFDEVNGGAENA